MADFRGKFIFSGFVPVRRVVIDVGESIDAFKPQLFSEKIYSFGSWKALVFCDGLLPFRRLLYFGRARMMVQMYVPSPAMYATLSGLSEISVLFLG